MLKLNMGCGQNLLAGFVNVDKFEAHDGIQLDVKHDLECFPWPWKTGSVAEVLFNHSLEHMGADSTVFLRLMQELYRVCAPDAVVRINVPHPRHDHFLGDPTHVRVITPEVLSLFSKKNCEHWAKVGAANSPLAMYIDVDFETVDTVMRLSPYWAQLKDEGQISAVELSEAVRRHNNVVQEIRMTLRVVKVPALVAA